METSDTLPGTFEGDLFLLLPIGIVLLQLVVELALELREFSLLDVFVDLFVEGFWGAHVFGWVFLHDALTLLLEVA